MIFDYKRPPKKYVLVDCDNFYVSCERVFQPHLSDKPVIILSNNDGCVVSRSQEAKALGIGMGEPFHHVNEIVKKENIKVFSSNYVLYGDLSRRVMDTLKEVTLDVEVYSIDEAFLVLPETFDEAQAEQVRKKVLHNTGVPVTIGIGETKTLSKIALEYIKLNRELDRVFDITNHPETELILSRILVQDIWGIGRRYAEWLYTRGINTAAQLRNISDQLIKKKAGVVGLRLVSELRGIPCIPLENKTPARKNITSSRSFGRYVTKLAELEESIATHSAMAAKKLREDGSVAGEITVFITTNVYAKNPQYGKAASRSLVPSTDCDHHLITAGKKVLHSIFKPGYNYIKAGVVLDKINPNGFRQTDIFKSIDYQKLGKLYKAIDLVNANNGGGTVRYLSTGMNKSWSMKMDYRSPRYTTNWQELPFGMAK